MRTRSRVTGFGRSYLQYTRRNESGVVTLERSEDMTDLGVFKTITDQVNPNFALLRSQGIPVIGALSVGESETTVSDGSLTWPDGPNTHTYSGDLCTPFARVEDVNLAERTAAINACKAIAAISALKKLNTAQIDTGEILGTLGSTINMFRHPLAGMQKLFSKMERKRVKLYGRKRKRRVAVVDESNRGDWYEATANVWLEYSFGFRPIFEDISKTIKIYEDQVDLFQSALRVAKGIHVRTLTGSSAETYVHGGENVHTGLTAESRREVTEKVLCASGVYYKIPMNYSPAARALGLGLHNVAGSLWNLAPYSWVVDQIVNVGDWIQASNPDPDLLYLGKYTTVKISRTDRVSANLKIWRASEGSAPTWHSGNGGSRTMRSISITREPDVTLPSNPQWNPNMGFLAQALNDAAFGMLQIRKLITRFHH